MSESSTTVSIVELNEVNQRLLSGNLSNKELYRNMQKKQDWKSWLKGKPALWKTSWVSQDYASK